ncbi:MAG: UDP-galactopyranose mutase [Devosia sp.]
MDVLVVGAGYAGSVSAERLASAGHNVRVIDRRPHIAGNAFDEVDQHGILIHRYGPHIFHTNAQRVVDYLSRFTAWRPYEHRVLAEVHGKRLPMPINRKTINGLYGLDLDEAGVAAFFERVREPRESLRTSEDVVLNSVGRELCDLFFRGYTRKQWGLDLSQLSAGVAARIPVRTNDDDRYFTDTFQQMPRDGYTAMFRNMLDHKRISVEFGRDFAQEDRGLYDLIVYTGPVDAYFDYRYGQLPYRSLRFDFEHLPGTEYFLPSSSVNFPNEHDYTRITEFKRMTGQGAAGTTIVREYPQAEGDPYYPIPRPENEALYQRYKALAAAEKNTVFVGRLAQYRYYNMDQVVAAALTAMETITGT